MDRNTNKSQRSTGASPHLEALIRAIDRRIDQVPNPYIAEGFEALLGSAAQAYRNRGRQHVRFLLNNVAFALPLQNALEIDYLPEIAPLPNLPPWVLGICHLHGDIVSVVDPKQIMRLKSGDADKTKKLILIRNEDVITAIVVDKIEGVLLADDQNNQMVTNLKENKAFSKFVQSVYLMDQHQVHILDVVALMKAISLGS
jgi:purine-binding chemotaxis protein CheW